MGLLFFKALADETRLRLANILLHYELSVNELVQILNMGQSRVSRHLKILSEAGLLLSRRDGLWVFYQSPKTGRAREFLDAALPFVTPSQIFSSDLEMAARVIEERVNRTRQFFNGVAEHWDELNREVLGDFDLSNAVINALPQPCGTAVDLGCGTGGVLKALLEKSQMIIGVDGSAKMLELCKRRFEADKLTDDVVSLRIGELRHLPLADKEADFACLNLVLHHLPSPANSLAEVFRIMAPNGILFLSEFKRHNDETMRNRYGDQWLGFEEMELQGFLKLAGFTLLGIHEQPVRNNHKLFLITARA